MSKFVTASLPGSPPPGRSWTHLWNGSTQRRLATVQGLPWPLRRNTPGTRRRRSADTAPSSLPFQVGRDHCKSIRITLVAFPVEFADLGGKVIGRIVEGIGFGFLGRIKHN